MREILELTRCDEEKRKREEGERRREVGHEYFDKFKMCSKKKCELRRGVGK